MCAPRTLLSILMLASASIAVAADVVVEDVAASDGACLIQKQAVTKRPEAHPSDRVVTVTLGKQHVPVQRNNRTVAWKTAYFGTVYAGYPAQQFTVVFDTGSGHFILPSFVCSAEPCLKHRRYNPRLSQTAVDVEHDGKRVLPAAQKRDRATIQFGTGQVSGEFIEERICLDSSAAHLPPETTTDCTVVRVVAAFNMTTEPFTRFSFDGVLGLGFDSLALQPEFSFFGQMRRAHPEMKPIFAVYLARGDDLPSEISFGGYNKQRLAPDTPIAWTPVVSAELGYWLVQIKGMRINGEAVPLCEDGSCRGILDTGTSLLGVPQEQLTFFHWELARTVETIPEDCRDFPGPTLEFDFGEFSISLEAPYYTRPAPARMKTRQGDDTAVFCRPSLLPVSQPNLGSNIFIFGEPVLQRYYTAFDWSQQRVGFGTLAGDAAVSRPIINVL